MQVTYQIIFVSGVQHNDSVFILWNDHPGRSSLRPSLTQSHVFFGRGENFQDLLSVRL